MNEKRKTELINSAVRVVDIFLARVVGIGFLRVVDIVLVGVVVVTIVVQQSSLVLLAAQVNIFLKFMFYINPRRNFHSIIDGVQLKTDNRFLVDTFFADRWFTLSNLCVFKLLLLQIFFKNLTSLGSKPF